MKRTVPVLSIMIWTAVFCNAQVPQKFNYQAVVRNAQHAVISNQEVGFKLSILEGSPGGSPVYVETHSVTTSAVGLANLVIGEGLVSSGTFADILWGENSHYLKVEVDPSGGSAYEHLGTSQMISVPYSLWSGNISSPTRKFTVQEEAGHPVDSALFEVRNAEGQTVFAVYPEGTRVYVLDEEAKGRKGGFAVGGYSRKNKGITQEYMHVSPDSIRLYFDDESTKGRKGGFAVGGYSRKTKGATDNYFELKPDSAKFLMVSDQPADSHSGALSIKTKSIFGGDAEQGANLFNLTRDNYFIGHRAGESISGGANNSFFGFESGQGTTSGYGNIFLGQQSGQLNTIGSFNSFIGPNTGQSNVDGNNNVYLGFSAGRDNKSSSYNVHIGPEAGLHSLGGWNVFIGSGAGTNHVKGYSNIFLGQGAGYDADTSYANIFIGQASGYRNSGGSANVFLGNATGNENITGTNNTFIGHETGRFNINGEGNTFLGAYSGHENADAFGNVFLGLNAGRSNESGNTNVFVGQNAGYNHASGSNNIIVGDGAGFNNITGESNVFLGTLSGFNNNGKDNIFIGNKVGMDETGDGMLYIDIDNHTSENALIYGEFYNSKVRINNQLGVGMSANDYALEVAGEVFKTTPEGWLTNSDARIKTDVLEIENALEQISRLRPVIFRYTDEWKQMNPALKDKVYYNYIAQEFREVFPSSVQQGGRYLAGDEDPLLQMDSYPAQVVAIRAIQELARQNQEQQAVIDALLQKVSALEEEIWGAR